MENSVSMLGLAKKAGKLELGEESVAAAVHSGRARAVLSAADASERSVRQARSLAEQGGAPHMLLGETKDELGAILGRGSPGMAAITDAGLAAAYAGKLAAREPEKYGEAARELKETAERLNQRKKKTTAGTCKRRTKNEHDI